MLSQDIRNLHHALVERAAERTLTEEEFRLALDHLAALAERVAELECLAVPAGARGPVGDHANVVALRRRGARIPVTPDDGSAA